MGLPGEGPQARSAGVPRLGHVEAVHQAQERGGRSRDPLFPERAERRRLDHPRSHGQRRPNRRPLAREGAFVDVSRHDRLEHAPDDEEIDQRRRLPPFVRLPRGPRRRRDGPLVHPLRRRRHHRHHRPRHHECPVVPARQDPRRPVGTAAPRLRPPRHRKTRLGTRHRRLQETRPRRRRRGAQNPPPPRPPRRLGRRPLQKPRSLPPGSQPLLQLLPRIIRRTRLLRLRRQVLRLLPATRTPNQQPQARLRVGEASPHLAADRLGPTDVVFLSSLLVLPSRSS
mmetsp:Transcript_21061/g.67855  ORF Transcript_21061/g.67855 Transcript_21061/m.67855 type:complete len:283 (+) Transcript_21061:542-1390(+)